MAGPLYEQDEEGEDRHFDGKLEEQEEGQTTPSHPSPSHGQATWTMENVPSREQRPGPRPLNGRRWSAAQHSNSNTSINSETLSDSSRVLAAGAGTRIGPKSVPKSSSSLRHISSKGKKASFGVPLHEDGDPNVTRTGNYRTVESSVEAAKRRHDRETEVDDILDDSSDDDHLYSPTLYSGETKGWEADLYSSFDKKANIATTLHIGQGDDQAGVSDYDSSGPESEHARRDGENEGKKGGNKLHDIAEGHSDGVKVPTQRRRISEERRSWMAKKRAERYDNSDPGGPSLEGPRRAAWHSRGPVVADSDNSFLHDPSSGLTTPGPNFATSLHTPEGSPALFEIFPTIEPRQRLEWHTMLQSVLRSEVLQSETKRITSADTVSLTKRELMYQRWLDIRASLRGRGHFPGAIEMEEKRLRQGWPVLLHEVIDAVKQCRTKPASAENKENVKIEDPSIAINDLTGTKEAVLEEVGSVLRLVDEAEEQFPSWLKLVEVVPQWTEEKLQRKLDGLYSWYNVTSSLRLQMQILQQWTGSKTLDITGQQVIDQHGLVREEKKEASTIPLDGAKFPAKEVEETTFLERLLKEDSLQSTFEKRTLRILNQLTLKAKSAIREHHEAFSEMMLPSFEPELSQLISFPTRLMAGALKLRLDYAGKLKDPSLLIVDSLTDDLRAAIALACRIKLQYTTIMIPDLPNGWNLYPCIANGYDSVLREALRFFFKMLNYKLKGSVFFKETEILEPEWRFLSTAVEAIEGGDVIVAISITRFVNKLFKRIVNYFERELSAPTTRRNAVDDIVNAMVGMTHPNNNKELLNRGPSTAGGLTKGQVKMTLDEKVRWIHQVFNGVRIRSRKLLGFARDIRNRLENAAEYDLSSLSGSSHTADAPSEPGGGEAVPAEVTAHPTTKSNRMDLTQFLQTLIDAGYFLVLTGSFEAEGVYLIAEPSLSNKPELIQELFCKCLRRVKPSDEESSMAAKDNAINSALIGNDDDVKEETLSEHGGESIRSVYEEEGPKYLLVLSPRDAFLWTGRVMSLELPRIDVDLKERRLRLIADGTSERLQVCQMHLYSTFNATCAKTKEEDEEEVAVVAAAEVEPSEVPAKLKRKLATATSVPPMAPVKVADRPEFPLEVITERLAHISAVQTELRRINQGVYMLSDAIIRAVPKIRRNLRGRRAQQSQLHNISASISPSVEDRRRGIGASGDSDELIQNCFSMASEQGFRALPFIESDRLRGQMTLALATLAIDWVAFICDDCEPSDRKTFKWAVAALENAQHVTRSGEILNISEEDFILMRKKVASCVGLLISHFDILGARSSVANAKEEEERLEREKAERAKALEVTANGEYSQAAAKMVQGIGTAGAPPMLNRADSGMQATEERWVGKVMEWDAARQAIEAEQRLIGRVLDDTRLEDRGLQFLASSSSRIQIRWQQGRFIGGGTFGTVYLAVNLDSGGLMAVKEIRFQDISSTPTAYKQIKDEMSVMEMLSHPNIVEYYGIEVHRDKVYIFEEYCQGGSLAQLLEHGRIEDEAVIQVYTLQMLDGLVYLHSKGVVHRDIKPDNILLDHMGVIKFVDFGAAKILAKNSRTIQRSKKPGGGGGGGALGGVGAMTGMMGADGKPTGGAPASLQGTPMYMSPEVIKGETRGRRGAMDVWSLGCVVLEFATGRRPWSQLDNEWAIMFHIGMAQQHPPLPEPGQLSDLGIEFIRSCLVIDPYDRPSAIELREHPWIQNLVEELNRANEEENAHQDSLGPMENNSLSFVHGENSAAGVAAMVATPNTRSINGFNFNRPPTNSSGATSSFSRFSNDSVSSSNPASHISTPLTVPTSSIPMQSAKGAVDDRPVHDPGHPNHHHPGYDALVADVMYREEDRQTHEMLEPDTPYLDM
ncbi:hypothetical protein CBS101457_004645 [Exobasidium rhododendri]|nr:hypothetical protein CBS101457_004645 [Exobasidium rhododendri]